MSIWIIWMETKVQTDNPIYIQKHLKLEQSDNFSGLEIYITYKHMPYIDIALQGWNNNKGHREWCLLSPSHRKDYYEDQCYQNSQHNQLYLHVLQPHFSTDWGSRTPEVLCLKEKIQNYMLPLHNQNSKAILETEKWTCEF